MKMALVVGHKQNRQGAANQDRKIHEWEYNRELAAEITAQYKGEVEITTVFRDTYKSLPAKINRLDPDFVVSLHCNAFNRKAGGTCHLYYHASIPGRALADIYQQKIMQALELQDRGIIPRDVEDRGGYLLRYTNAPCVISEPFFIDNNNDFAKAEKQRTKLVQAHLEAIDLCAAALAGAAA